ncbi:MAG TPA: Hsp20/alpha crystallin family protein [Candidatus Bathyarchaeota archaeon]|nr:Hsp20/alpha crystallin family protein [Candidatus Bathyarchaeota archaeon]
MVRMAFWFGFWRDIDREMRELRRRLRRAFEEATAWLEVGPEPMSMIRPLVDVYETPDEVVVVAELPGVKKEDIEVSVIDNRLEIRAEVRREEEVKREAYHRRERYYRGFLRRIPLPTPVDPSGAKATYEDGILTIRLPKLAKEKRHRIKVE